MEAEVAGSTGLAMLVSWPCIGCRTSLPSVVKSNVAFLDTGGSSRLAVHTIVFSATPARKIPTAYPLPCWWNPKAYKPEGDGQDKFEPGVIEEPRLILEWRALYVNDVIQAGKAVISRIHANFKQFKDRFPHLAMIVRVMWHDISGFFNP
ncbi:hypothetical protein RJ640_016863 [Escallonia rubra]|uniref:Uncharacterized protein n=1 Tax=Escallonia rubra TaxID=112253 RepID=A0AA88RNB0_9ASTE|nr:hypothetical protein RJ640_016863 [Escallonia rubra]